MANEKLMGKYTKNLTFLLELLFNIFICTENPLGWKLAHITTTIKIHLKGPSIWFPFT